MKLRVIGGDPILTIAMSREEEALFELGSQAGERRVDAMGGPVVKDARATFERT